MNFREELRSLARTAARMRARREIKVDDEEFNRRMSICLACRKVGHFRRSHQCRVCGCILERKARLLEFHCDLGKW